MRSIDQIQVWDAERVASGGIFMVWGLFMKMVIADRDRDSGGYGI